MFNIVITDLSLTVVMFCIFTDIFLLLLLFKYCSQYTINKCCLCIKYTIIIFLWQFIGWWVYYEYSSTTVIVLPLCGSFERKLGRRDCGCLLAIYSHKKWYNWERDKSCRFQIFHLLNYRITYVSLFGISYVYVRTFIISSHIFCHC